jgi:hypothetical protein
MLLAGMMYLSYSLRRVALHFSPLDIHHFFRIFAVLQSSGTGALPMLRDIEILDHTLSISFLQDTIRHCATCFGSTLEAFAAHVRTENLEAGQVTQLALSIPTFHEAEGRRYRGLGS